MSNRSATASSQRASTCDAVSQVALGEIAFYKTLAEIQADTVLPTLSTGEMRIELEPVSLAGRFNDTLAAALERTLRKEANEFFGSPRSVYTFVGR